MTPAIKIQGLSKNFGPTQVLKNIDLEVAPQTVTCLIGPSGSGKSTLLRCIAFLEEASEGLIQIEGEFLGFTPEGAKRTRLPAPKIRAVRSRIGMVFQQFNLWPHMTALGNVREALVTVRGMAREEADKQWDDIQDLRAKAYMTCRAAIAAKDDFDMTPEDKRPGTTEDRRRRRDFFRVDATVGMD